MCEGQYNNRKCRISVELQGKPGILKLYNKKEEINFIRFCFVPVMQLFAFSVCYIVLGIKSFQENDREKVYEKAYSKQQGDKIYFLTFGSVVSLKQNEGCYV